MLKLFGILSILGLISLATYQGVRGGAPFQTQKKLVICLEWFLNPHHAPLIVGQERGFFKEEDIKLEIISAAGSDEGCKQVSAGAADLALTGQPHFMMMLEKELPLTRVASLIDTPLEVWISWHPLPRLRTLKKVRIAHASSGKGFSMKLLDHFLEKQEIALKNVEKIMVRHGLEAAFLSKKVEMILNVFKTYSLPDIMEKEPNIIVLSLKDLGIPPYEELIFVANSDQLNQKTMEKFTRALKKSIAFIKKHPNQAWKDFIRNHKELDSPVNRLVWKKVGEVFSTDPGHFDASKYDVFSKFLQKIGFLSKRLCGFSSDFLLSKEEERPI